MAQKYTGTCTECGEEDVEVTLIDEETSLCDNCLDELDYYECDECHEYWLADVLEPQDLKDGRTLCRHCVEALMEDGELTSEDFA